MNIGTVKQNKDGVYIGSVVTLAASMVIGLRPVDSNNEAAPKYDIMGKNVAGVFIPLGGLWEKNAASDGKPFLQGSIDDPSLESPINIALFEQEDGSMNVAWSRPQRKNAGFGGEGVTGDDAPPFTPDAGQSGGAAEQFGGADDTDVDQTANQGDLVDA